MVQRPVPISGWLVNGLPQISTDTESVWKLLQPYSAVVRNLPVHKTQEMQVRSLGQEDPLDESLALHSGILA